MIIINVVDLYNFTISIRINKQSLQIRLQHRIRIWPDRHPFQIKIRVIFANEYCEMIKFVVETLRRFTSPKGTIKIWHFLTLTTSGDGSGSELISGSK